jgi:arylsulfatase A
LGINVPLIVNCPGRVPAGRVVHELVDFSDFLPTLADLAGAPLPAGVTIDGRSFAGLLRGGERRPRRDWVFSQYYRTRMVGDGRYKLYNTGELFDVLQDVDESVDLSKQDDRRLAAVRSRLRAVLDSLPKDAELPFAPRSQSAFAIRAREAQPAPAAKPPR